MREIITLLKSRVRNYHQLAVTCRAYSEHPEMPQVVLLHKMPCDSTSCTGTQVVNRIPGNVTPPPLSRVLRAAPLMLNEQSKILTSTQKSTTRKADPPDRGPHRTQARRVPCCISPHYGIISTLKIPAVSSGETWTLQLRNFLRTCITQGPEYFRHLPFPYSY